MTALLVEDLWFGYGRTPTVRGVTMTVAPGDCYGFLGHNGAGKTTVLRLCLGLLRPSRGRVAVFGSDLARAGRLARSATGALIERPGFVLGATARQNLRWLARLQGMPPTLAAAETSRVLDRTGLAPVAERRVGTFSMGMRQRLGVAQALLGQPRLLLLDEPTNGLDPEGIADLRALLRSLARDDGVAVLLSSHQLHELDGLCTHIGVLRGGELLVEGSVATLRGRLQRHYAVAGPDLPALQAQLAAQGLGGAVDDGRLLVELGSEPPAQVLRRLAASAEVTSFAPEAITLETLYQRAAELAGPAEAHRTPSPAPALPAAAAAQPLWRVFRHELATTLARRSNRLLALLPAASAAWTVYTYHQKTLHHLARVTRGEQFSADAGSGQFAMALALQNAVPCLGLVLLWWASQSVAADLSRDTLRNTLQRSVARGDVWYGKLGALAALAGGSFALLLLSALLAAAVGFGFGDLVEVTRHGDQQPLAAASDVTPVLWRALGQCLLPLGALLATGTLASVLARRPARALALAFALVLVPELLRARLGPNAGWLLTSHLPAGLRDDSAVAYLVAVARGAADAHWQYEGAAVWAPLAWCGAAALLGRLWFARLRAG